MVIKELFDFPAFNFILFSFLVILFISCNKEELGINQNSPEFLSAVDISSYPEIELANPTFFGRGGTEDDFLNILKENGVNTIRLRLWVNPDNNHSGFDEILSFSERLRAMGFKIWISVHYSDTWADPGHQETPQVWADLDFEELKIKLINYTEKIARDINPEIIQIGNEINSGFLHPHGNINSQQEQFITLLQTAAATIRSASPQSKIMIHFAGHENADCFFDQIVNVDYDFIGLSYYPIWHGKSLNNLKNTMNALSTKHNKDILIAETAYPFTLDWNDWTNNILGQTDQLIIPEYPATPAGQSEFVCDMISMIQEINRGIGICYWGSELISWKGAQSPDASPWENQALFDFDNRAVPALECFKQL